MARGLFSGVVIGLILSAAVVFFAALSIDRVELGEPTAPTQEVPAIETPVDEPVPSEETLSGEPEPAPNDLAEAAEAINEDRDEAQADTAQRAPEPEGAAPAEVDEAPAPVAESPAAEAPVADDTATAVTDAPADAPDAPAMDSDAASMVPEPETPEAATEETTDESTAERPAAPAPDAMAEAEDEVATDTEDAPSIRTIIAPEAPERDVVSINPSIQPRPQPETEPQVPAMEPRVNRLPQVSAPSSDASQDTLLAEGGDDIGAAPVGRDLLNRDDAPAPEADDNGVVSNRLPRIQADADADATEAPVPAGPASTDPIDVNAVPFTGAPDLPRMSVLLLDTGAARTEVGDLALLPFPLSVAVDASAPDAEEAIDYYRANGAEIILIVPLPQGATATDVDVTFQVYDPLLEQAVAVMIPEDAGFQSLGQGAEQVATILSERGLGLVSWAEGLNTGHKAAVSAGVPAALVFRDLDSEGQSPDVIRRFLDNVAFRARNEEGTIATARVRPDSLQAVLEWSLGNRAQSINMAPVSATLPR